MGTTCNTVSCVTSSIHLINISQEREVKMASRINKQAFERLLVERKLELRFGSMYSGMIVTTNFFTVETETEDQIIISMDTLSIPLVEIFTELYGYKPVLGYNRTNDPRFVVEWKKDNWQKRWDELQRLGVLNLCAMS